MKRLIFITACVMIGFLCSCEKYIIPAPDVPTDVSFSADVQPIFNAKCVNCHGGNRAPDLRPNNSYNALVKGDYVNTDDPEASELYQVLLGSHNSRATPDEKATILGWIYEGAENN